MVTPLSLSLTPGGRTTATAVENYITLFLLLFKASPWGTEAIYALNRWITKWGSFSAKRALRNIEIRIFLNFLLQSLPISRLPFKYGVAKTLVRHLLTMVKRRTVVFYFVLGKVFCVYRIWYCVQLLCWQNFHFSSVL